MDKAKLCFAYQFLHMTLVFLSDYNHIQYMGKSEMHQKRYMLIEVLKISLSKTLEQKQWDRQHRYVLRDPFICDKDIYLHMKRKALRYLTSQAILP